MEKCLLAFVLVIAVSGCTQQSFTGGNNGAAGSTAVEVPLSLSGCTGDTAELCIKDWLVNKANISEWYVNYFSNFSIYVSYKVEAECKNNEVELERKENGTRLEVRCQVNYDDIKRHNIYNIDKRFWNETLVYVGFTAFANSSNLCAGNCSATLYKVGGKFTNIEHFHGPLREYSFSLLSEEDAMGILKKDADCSYTVERGKGYVLHTFDSFGYEKGFSFSKPVFYSNFVLKSEEFRKGKNSYFNCTVDRASGELMKQRGCLFGAAQC